MVYIDQRHIRIRMRGKERIHPDQVFAGHLPGAHPHVGARVGAHEKITFVYEGECLTAEHFAETIASTFGPVGIVVARDDIPR